MFQVLIVMTWLTTFAFPSVIRANDYINKKPGYPVMVPDTGQTRCYDTHKDIPCPGPGKPFYGQDGNYSINAPVYELKNQDGSETIIDRITGLSWQRIPDGIQRTWSEAIDYANDLNLSGFTDWRLPNKYELQSILSYGTTPSPLLEPSANKLNNVTTEQNPCAWTLTSRTFPSLYAKTICLADNQGAISDKYEKNFVYAVRGLPLTCGKFQDNGNDTVTDQMTGLMWQAVEVRAKEWKQALAYCRQLDLGGYRDWRLPTIKELSTLVDESRANPSIDATFFPGTRSAAYWSSTTFTGHPGFSWYVRFDNGLEYNGGYKGRRYFVRAVRGGVIAAVPVRPSSIPRPALEEENPELKSPVLPDRDNMDLLEPYPLPPNPQQYE